MTNRYALFDLDGTITDPKAGITGSYQMVLQEYGIEPPTQEDLLWVIGPALRECLPKLIPLKTSQDIEHAVTRYRHYYVTQGEMYKDTPYPGIAEALASLRDHGVTMVIATAKAHPYAAQILEHWGLRDFFRGVYGSELDGTRSYKADLLKYLLEQEKIVDKSRCVMIGDRHHDIHAAQKNGLASVGVVYGYGSEEELTKAGATVLCEGPAMLVEKVLRLLRR